MLNNISTNLLLKICGENVVRDIYKALLAADIDDAARKTKLNELRKNGLEAFLTDLSKSELLLTQIINQHSEKIVKSILLGLFARAPNSESIIKYSRLLRENGIEGLLAELVQSNESREALLTNHAENLVAAIFKGILGREPDEIGFQNKVTNFKINYDIEQLVKGIAFSKEFWTKSLARNATDILNPVLKGILNRDPSQSEIESMRDCVHSSKLFETTLRKIVAQEFTKYSAVAPNEKIINGIYLALLNRPANSNEKVKGINQSPDDLKVDDLVREILESREFKFNKTKSPNPMTRFNEPYTVFIHIQKTAGSTLNKMLIENFGIKESINANYDNIFCFSAGELGKKSFLYGHINYDCLSYIHKRKVQLVTFFRDPIQRIISLYYYWLSFEPVNPGWNKMIALASEYNSIEKFFENAVVRNSPDVWNHMTWAIIGDEKWRMWKAQVSKPMDKVALDALLRDEFRPFIKSRLLEFKMVGIQEEFDCSIKLLFNVLGKPAPSLTEKINSFENLKNFNDGRFKQSVVKEMITDRLLGSLGELVLIDRIVYEEAVLIFSNLKLASKI